MKNSLVAVLFVLMLVAGLTVGWVGGGFILAVRTPLTSTTTQAQAAQAPSHADITMVVEGHEGGSLGTDGKTHDTVIPANFAVYMGQIVNLTVVNYDEGPHTFTSPGLGVNFQIPGHVSAGVPSVSHFQFAATKAGVFRWWCSLPCDTGQGGWAMTTGSDGQPDKIGFMSGFVTVLGA